MMNQSILLAAVREELQAAVDQLPDGGSQEGQHHRGRGGDDHEAPCHPWQQVFVSKIPVTEKSWRVYIYIYSTTTFTHTPIIEGQKRKQPT
jgi:hypothetical protein